MDTTLQNTVEWLAEIGFDGNGNITTEMRHATPVNGASRRVFFCDGIAYKFTTYGDNRTEWDTYHEMPEAVQALMARPLAISKDGNVLAMEQMRITLTDWKNETEEDRFHESCTLLDEFNETLKSALVDAGYSNGTISMMMADNHKGNIAFDHDGNLRWIDYAMA